jgi:hypothetical protein
VHPTLFLPSSHPNDEEREENPQQHLLENPQEGADDKPKTDSEILQRKQEQF